MGGIKTINMEKLKDELKKLQELLNNPTPENEAMYQSKFIEIKNKFTSKEDANIIADLTAGCSLPPVCRKPKK